MCLQNEAPDPADDKKPHDLENITHHGVQSAPLLVLSDSKTVIEEKPAPPKVDKSGHEHEMQVFVTGLEGKTTTYDVTSLTTVREFKVMVNEKTGVAVGALRLTYAGKELIGDATRLRLRDYGVEVRNATLYSPISVTEFEHPPAWAANVRWPRD